MNIEEQTAADRHVVGLISDTHGMVRADVHRVLEGVELILHAGDVGEGVLEELKLVAPVQAVSGNTDPLDDPALPPFIELTLGGVSIHVSHGHEVGAPKPEKLLGAYMADVIVYGHTHKQSVVQAGDRLVVNPGAAGARRFKLLPSVGILIIEKGMASVTLVELRDD